ncbi:hypothetical protein BAY1663_02291 [Pseudomonas sp. BAY1663]|uniref:hypothetical protein n=1 Tax=Pseudomonas sp. BAY1663 TaxID=1439940 RepID=UPI00042DF9F3|nr:hypothetical protein [Pseudomonas sp. BAY1663]EXF45212.1 hypothetical protein BAY1663_02291 [Pseudomonas sp. BAY1663]
MSKVLVDPAALEEAAKWLEVHSSSSGSAEAFAAEALREAIAQPAEAGGVDFGFDDRSVKVSQEAYSIFLERERALQDALSAVTAERDRLQSQLAETQANDRAAMGYLHDVRQLVGGSDFPEMVRNVARMVDALPGCVELIEALSPIECDVLRKARAAMAAKEA